MAFYPYLSFGGNCREAMTRYHEIFGGTLDLMSMADMPAGEAEVPADQVDLIMHSALVLPDGGLLMAGDAGGQDIPAPQGMCVNVTVASTDEAQRVFAALADGGRVDMAIEPSFFSPMFGMCTDRFGTPWLVNTEAPAQS